MQQIRRSQVCGPWELTEADAPGAPTTGCHAPEPRLPPPGRRAYCHGHRLGGRGEAHDIRDGSCLGEVAGGELIRSDVITGLRCHGGEVEAVRQDGGVARLGRTRLPARLRPGFPPRAGAPASPARRPVDRHRLLREHSRRRSMDRCPARRTGRGDQPGDQVRLTGYRSSNRSACLAMNVPRPCRVMIRLRSRSTCIACRSV
jgi:hypothetical protein